MIQSINTQQEKTILYSLAAAIFTIVVSSNRVKKIIQCQVQRMQLMSLVSSPSHEEKDTKCNKITVSGIYIHPIKSIRPISVQSTEFDNLGLVGDRDLMLVRPTSLSSSNSPNASSHRFITQRQCPALATIDASLPTELTAQKKMVIQLSHESQKEKVFIDITPSVLKSNPVRYKAGIWDDDVDVVDVGDKAAAFIQKIIQTEEDAFDDVRVVSIIPNVTDRKADERYVPLAACNKLLGTPPQTSLQDGFPVLITSEESLGELNRRMVEKGKHQLPMSRFRPNIVVKGLSKPFDEDEWKAIQIGGKNGPIFHIVKGCPRCKQSCTDQVTGERDLEPLETLKDFRALGKNDEDVYFGQNVLLQPISGLKRLSSSVYVGDEVRILTRGDPVWDIDQVEAE